MLNYSKFSIAILTLGIALTLSADITEAGRGRRGGNRRGRSMSRSQNRSKSTGQRNRTQFKQSQNRISRTQNRPTSRFKNSRVGKTNNNSSRISNKLKTNKFSSKNFNSKKFNKNIGQHKNHNHHNGHGNHGNHKNHWNHGHHNHYGHHGHHWNGWHGWYRPVVWGINTYRPAPAYCNPYCSSIEVGSSFGYPGQANMSFDYSKPITDQNNDVTEAGGRLMDEARQAFLEGNYELASRIIAKAAQEMPKNHDVHQFRSLILFAMGDYSNSAGAAHVALTGGPGWNWTTLRSFYKEKETYTTQLRRLEDSRQERSEAAEIRFLLGYHYLMMTHVDSAAKELSIAVELEPRDELSKKLLDAISEKTGKTYPVTPITPEQKEIKVVPVPPEAGLPESTTTQKPVNSYSGIYKANSGDGVNFTLNLNTNGTFKWSVESIQNKNDFSGTYQIDNNVMTLTRAKDGEKMIAVLTPIEKGFNFKMENGTANDPGLNFQP